MGISGWRGTAPCSMPGQARRLLRRTIFKDQKFKVTCVLNYRSNTNLTKLPPESSRDIRNGINNSGRGVSRVSKNTRGRKAHRGDRYGEDRDRSRSLLPCRFVVVHVHRPHWKRSSAGARRLRVHRVGPVARFCLPLALPGRFLRAIQGSTVRPPPLARDRLGDALDFVGAACLD